MNLFIIGNGFDLSHNLKTKYEHFHNYLRKEYPNDRYGEIIMPEVFINLDGGEGADDKDVVRFIVDLISLEEPDEWNDVENTLGELDFSECFDWLDYRCITDDGSNFWRNVYNSEDIGTDLVTIMLKINKYFNDWIETININTHPKKGFKNLINKDIDLFLTFNYTETLQKVYKVKNVCHIHGKQGDEILFGHGNDIEFHQSSVRSYMGSEDAWSEIHWNLRKNTESALKRHKHFFNKIDSNIKKIYSCGFSFSKVDLIYIKEICGRLTNKNMKWFLNDFDKIKHERYKKVLRECGYVGEFDSFSIK